jgi:transglutaminase-like putative cysteine protease
MQGVVLCLAFSVFAYFLATPQGLMVGCVSIMLATLASVAASHLRLRLPLRLVLAGLVLLLGHGAQRWALDAPLGANVRATLLLADLLLSSVMVFGAVFALRSLSACWRLVSLLEMGFVIGAAAYIFAPHRNNQLNRPRFLSDWAFTRGLDPTQILQGIGLTIALLSVLLLLRRQPIIKFILTWIALLLLGLLLYWWREEVRIEPVVSTQLGLTQQEQDKRSNDGQSDDEDPFGPPPPSGRDNDIVPIAIAILRDDFEPPGGIFYFRQQVLSRYNGHHLVAADAPFDGDVIRRFPSREPIDAEPVQVPNAHIEVPTTTYLLVDHPQPISLSMSVRLEPARNPNPKLFVAAYEVLSRVLSMSPERLLGRASIPDSWTPAQREHYLALPDDPRYRALSEIIVRDIDPRFAQEDLFKALAIKRYLEKEGFYTLKERHESAEDPAASFLFGSMRGYCVHFAHSAVYLLRSQGIAARVALGYAADTQFRGAGSAVMILSDRAHAWPEIHIDGVGWLTFDIYPEASDEPPRRIIDQDLESLLAELARDDKTGGRAADPDSEWWTPTWGQVLLGLGLLLLSTVLALFLAKGLRWGLLRLPAPWRRMPRLFMATMDRLAELGFVREEGEAREHFATRMASMSPSLPALTGLLMERALGRPRPEEQARERLLRFMALRRKVLQEVARAVPWQRRWGAWLNPVAWWRSR